MIISWEKESSTMNKIIGIYKYQNKLNGNIYIGQSVDINRRYNQHLQEANSNKAITAIDLAISKYGIENFDFSIIEECPKEKLDERERYWIQYYDSYNNGYNNTPGGVSLRGSEHPRALLDENDVWEIREMYKNHISRRDVFKKFKNKISERGFLKVWNCENWTDIHTDVYTEENKQWHKKNVGHSEDQAGFSSLDRAIEQDEIDDWVDDYKNGLSINAIAKKYNRDNGTVEKYIANPTAIKKVKYTGRTIQNVNTGEIFKSIKSAAEWAECGATTLTRHLAKDKIAGKVPGTNESAIWVELE